MTLSADTVTAPQTSRAPTSLHFERFRPRLGALVNGIDLSQPLDAHTPRILHRLTIRDANLI